ncbi:MAG TPA: cupredoxin domain-containing protein [Sporichthyaceae bacterium]|nr:cupredoxin domain-containing protein [Sporichthyaceae bacterium]
MIVARHLGPIWSTAFGVALIAGLAGCGATITAAQPPAPSPLPVVAATPTIGVIPSVNPIPISNGLAPTPATATIRMYTDAPFEPATLTVPPATVITVINEGREICNLSDQGQGIGSNDIGPGSSVHMTAPDTPGTYSYNCTYYPETMKGTLIVANVTTPSSATPATATPTATASPTVSPTATTSATQTTSPTHTTTPAAPPEGASPGPAQPPTPGGPGYLKHPEKCRRPTFQQAHLHACAGYGISPSSKPTDDDSDGPDDD